MKENIILTNLCMDTVYLKLKSSELRFCHKKKLFLAIFKWFLPLHNKNSNFFIFLRNLNFYKVSVMQKN